MKGRAIGDRITSTRSAILPSSQTPSDFRCPSSTSRLARSYPAKAGACGDIPDNESDVVVGDIDHKMPEEQRRCKTEKEHRTDLYDDSPAPYNLVNRSTCLRILMDWVQENLSDPAFRLEAPEPE